MRKSVKSFIALLLCIGFVPAAAAFAAADVTTKESSEISVKIDVTSEDISVSGSMKNGAAGDAVTALILNPGKTAANWGEDNAVQNQAELSLDAKKEFSFKTPVSDLSGQGGVYTAYFKGAKMSAPLAVPFYFSDSATKEELIRSLNACTTAEAAKQKLAELEDSLLFGFEVLEKIDTAQLAQKVADKVKSAPFDVTDYQSAVKWIKVETVLEAIRQNRKDVLTDSSGYLLYLDVVGIDSMDESNSLSVVETYSDQLTAAGVSGVASALFGQTYANVSALQRAFAGAVIVEGIRSNKAGGSGHIASLLRKNASYVGLDLSKYTNPTTLKDKELFSKKYGDLSHIQEVLSSDIKEESKGSSKGSSGKSSSGFSGISMSDGEFGITPEIEQIPGEGATPAAVFDDMVFAEWARPAVEGLIARNIVSKPADGRFRPNDAISREEFAKMVVLTFGLSADVTDEAFSDVPQSRWSAPYVYAAARAGIVNGIGDGLFGATYSLSRQDMAVMIYRAYEQTGKALSRGEAAAFSDEAEVSGYAREAVAALCGAGVINGMGDGSFGPNGICTRAQTAKVLYSILNPGYYKSAAQLAAEPQEPQKPEEPEVLEPPKPELYDHSYKWDGEEEPWTLEGPMKIGTSEKYYEGETVIYMEGDGTGKAIYATPWSDELTYSYSFRYDCKDKNMAAMSFFNYHNGGNSYYALKFTGYDEEAGEKPRIIFGKVINGVTNDLVSIETSEPEYASLAVSEFSNVTVIYKDKKVTVKLTPVGGEEVTILDDYEDDTFTSGQLIFCGYHVERYYVNNVVINGKTTEQGKAQEE